MATTRTKPAPATARRAARHPQAIDAAAQRALTAWAIRTAREWRAMSREELAAELNARLEGGRREWTANMVQKLEAGRKVVTVDLLAALSAIQEMPLAWYFFGPASSVSEGRAGNGYVQREGSDQGGRVLDLTGKRVGARRPRAAVSVGRSRDRQLGMPSAVGATVGRGMATLAGVAA